MPWKRMLAERLGRSHCPTFSSWQFANPLLSTL